MIIPGVKSAGGAGESSDAEPVCEECSQAKNLIHCIDASIQVKIFKYIRRADFRNLALLSILFSLCHQYDQITKCSSPNFELSISVHQKAK